MEKKRGSSARESHDAANKALDVLLVKFQRSILQAMKNMKKDQEELLTFYNFPSEQVIGTFRQ
ncbi:MAG: hypothetical protein ACTS73_07305 [Arsenophonus sp. NEOnobi-MAG3]